MHSAGSISKKGCLVELNWPHSSPMSLNPNYRKLNTEKYIPSHGADMH